jgi:Transposase DDE domain group 1
VKTKLRHKRTARKHKNQQSREKHHGKRNRHQRRRDRLLNARQRALERRLDKTKLPDSSKPIMRGCPSLRYDLSDRVCGTGLGGIPLMHQLAKDIGLIDAIDKNLHILKIHMPYSDSDHVLNLAFNPLCNGDCLQDIELRRNDIGFLDALGAERIPDPTTAGDFCRRFDVSSINTLQDIFDDVRVGVWQQQPAVFFEQATIDVDGSIVGTTGECKQGMDIAYDGTWGFHPLIVSLANTREVLRIVNRSGNRPSHEGAAAALDQAIATCKRAGFRKILLRGDTDFSQTKHLDGWDDRDIQFIFGYDNVAPLKARVETFHDSAWQPLIRPARYEVKTTPRQRPDKVKDAIVVERGYETLRLQSEDVAEFIYRPVACNREYRMIVVRKNISKEKGGVWLYDEHLCFFYITNDWASTPTEIVFSANDRCHQENLIQQLKHGANALKAPLKTLESNWAYMVMTALAWNLKAWAALRLPESGRWAGKYRAEKLWLLGMEFKAFVNVMVAIPCQLVRQARQTVLRVLSCHVHLPTFFRLATALNC